MTQVENVYRMVVQAGIHGITAAELIPISGKTRTRASADLSALHRQGLIYRLAEKRENNSVYCIDAMGRQTVPYGRQMKPRQKKLPELAWAKPGRANHLPECPLGSDRPGIFPVCLCEHLERAIARAFREAASRYDF